MTVEKILDHLCKLKDRRERKLETDLNDRQFREVYRLDCEIELLDNLIHTIRSER